SASQTEYDFLRRLIEENRIPDDVTIQVLCQAREELVKRTFECLKGAKSAIFHIYNSTSPAQRKYTFNMSKEEIIQVAIDGIRCVKQCMPMAEGTKIRLQYSPESFSNTEIEFAVEICEAVKKEWGPTPDNKMILNLPTTVECSSCNKHADQIEYFCTHISNRDSVIISLHNHNDRGEGVASCQLALQAGADRVEGTLFGNGERTGNLDIVTVALNMYSQGVDPGLDFSDMPHLVQKYEACTRMQVYERAPYAGALVFAAFSGSHQDAIAKGMKYRQKKNLHEWSVPYIPIDPKDIGRTYDADVIRVNSQSGKGGIGYLLEQTYGYNLPAKMREHFSYLCKSISDREHKELKAEEVLEIFVGAYLETPHPISVTDFDFMRENETVKINITFAQNGVETELDAEGNGSLNAVSNALKAYTGEDYTLQVFTQHSMQGQGSQSVAASYIGLENQHGEMFWGAGTHTDVIKASTEALLNAFYNMTKGGNGTWE
ncbi:MAG: 2-isopropylmalate synthase, partial [Ruminococcus sp.]|nr:2-isopropylmalate synthase [Ruminococcus sp.]